MRRSLLLLLMFLAVLALSVPTISAQEEGGAPAPVAAEPAAEEGGEAAAPAGPGWAGPGNYLSMIKLLAGWLVFVIWVYTTDWVSSDAREYKFDHLKWNPIVFGTFMVAMVAFWFIPIFFVGFPLLIIAHLLPLLSYVKMRNSQVSDDEKVLTKKHLKVWFGKLTKKDVQVEDVDPHEAGPPVVLKPQGAGSERDDNVHLLTARQNPGFPTARQIIADGMMRRCDGIMLDYAQQGVAIRHLIDGVWQEAEPMEREAADPALEALKQLCGLKAEDRRSKQEGQFWAIYEKIKYDAKLTTQGTQTGERAVMQFEGNRAQFKSLDDLGMRPKMQEQVREVLALKQGYFLISAMPATGLRSTTGRVLMDADRFVREFMAFEDEENPYEHVENVHVTTYKKDDPEKSLAEAMRLFFLQEPQVVIMRDLVDGEMVGTICEEIQQEERLAVSTIRAKDCAEAMARVAALKPPLQEFSQCMSAVLNQRLVRKLCEDCKEAYAPPANVLQQLGIPQGRVQAFYRPPQPPEDPKQICKTCGGLGYLGRIALFEFLLVGDAVRAALASNPAPDALRAAARQDGMQTMQQEGIVLVAKGVTSLPELTRVLKQ